MKVALYARVSTVDQHPERQREGLKNYAEKMGWEYDYYEEKQSTKKTRPIKQELFNKLCKKEYDAIIVWKLFRWARTLQEAIREVNILVFEKNWSIGIFFIMPRFKNKRKRVRVTNKDVKRLESKPIVKVTANPLIGPEPNWKSMKAAIRVVELESIIALKALLKPFEMAACIGLPFAISSRILSLIRTFASTAIPRVKIIPAIPGSVRVTWDSGNIIFKKPIIPTINKRLNIRAIFEIIPALR